MAQQRKIIHIDMDAFFASVEQRDQPEYRDKPLIVGGKPNSRGVVAACSYEARQFGIHSAMPCSQAYRLCPQAIFVAPRFEAYRAVSDQIRRIFWRYASQVEPLSLDEAYLDVTYTADYEGSATLIAKAIKREILAETRLIASAGVSYNKFLAKIASDMDKPDGLTVIKPEQGETFVAGLAIGKFHGIGPATEAKMKKAGIASGKDLRRWTKEQLIEKFGKTGNYYYHIARAIDHRPVRSKRIRKSLGKETTFAENVMLVSELLTKLQALSEQVLSKLKTQELDARTLTLKVKYANFQQVTRAYTAEETLDLAAIKHRLPILMAKTEAGTSPVRLVGLSLSGFDKKKVEKTKQQLDLGLSNTFEDVSLS
ncbi:MAG: DNA polymerase IV [Proteobacteria bacterium]|nr:DNA polymerase IV [Pseudomonadota bacterium]